jgi:hypothetical protein
MQRRDEEIRERGEHFAAQKVSSRFVSPIQVFTQD